LAPGWLRVGSGWAQGWLRVGSGLAQGRLRVGSRKAQGRLEYTQIKRPLRGPINDYAVNYEESNIAIVSPQLKKATVKEKAKKKTPSLACMIFFFSIEN
jgi:hypothetical protein